MNTTPFPGLDRAGLLAEFLSACLGWKKKTMHAARYRLLPGKKLLGLLKEPMGDGIDAGIAALCEGLQLFLLF